MTFFKLHVCSKILSVPLINKDYYYSINFLLGNSNITTRIDFKISYIMIDVESYEPNKSNTSVCIKNQSIITYFGLFKNIEYQDYIFFSSFEPLKINFNIQDKNAMKIFEPGFGLGLNTSSNDQIFIYQLKEKGLIDKAGFTISPHENENNGTIYFGDVPNEIINSKRLDGRCLVNTSPSEWSCNISQIKIGKLIYNNSKFPIKSYFRITQGTTTIPHDVLKMLKISYLEKLLKEKKCNEYNIYGFPNIIHCDCNWITNLPEMEIVYDNFTLKINLIAFFRRNKENCTLEMRIDNLGRNDLILGLNFLNLFITHYDYENKSVSFYRDEVTIHNWKDNNLWKINLVIIIILILGILNILFRKVFLNK